MFLTTSASDESYDFRWWISITAFSVLMGSKYLLFRPNDCLEVMLLSGPLPVRRMKGRGVLFLWFFISIDWPKFVVLVINYPKYLKVIQRLHKWRLTVYLRHCLYLLCSLWLWKVRNKWVPLFFVKFYWFLKTEAGKHKGKYLTSCLQCASKFLWVIFVFWTPSS